MEREFILDDIVTYAKSKKVTYVCKTNDEDDPEITLRINFDRSVPTSYKRVLGSTRGDTFQMSLEGLRHQETLVTE